MLYEVMTFYLYTRLWQAGGLGQVFSEANARVWVGLKGGAQQLHMLLGEAGSFPAAGTARGATTGGSGIIWQTEETSYTLDRIHDFCLICHKLYSNFSLSLPNGLYSQTLT